MCEKPGFWPNHLIEEHSATLYGRCSWWPLALLSSSSSIGFLSKVMRLQHPAIASARLAERSIHKRATTCASEKVSCWWHRLRTVATQSSCSMLTFACCSDSMQSKLAQRKTQLHQFCPSNVAMIRKNEKKNKIQH